MVFARCLPGPRRLALLVWLLVGLLTLTVTAVAHAQPSMSASVTFTSGGQAIVNFSASSGYDYQLRGAGGVICNASNCEPGTYEVSADTVRGGVQARYRRPGQAWSGWITLSGSGAGFGSGGPSHPRLAGRVTAAADPTPADQVLHYTLTVTNTGRMNLTGVVWRTDPALGVTQRPVGDGDLAIGDTETVTGMFQLAPHHLPGPLIVTVYLDSDQTDEILADSVAAALMAPAESTPVSTPAPAPTPTPMPTPTPAPAGPRPGSSTLLVTVVRSAHAAPDVHLAHNIANLRVITAGGDIVYCDFLAHYLRTGGLERWGHAISEPLEEQPGALTQYYQRGAVDCTPQGGVWSVLRRLAWDFIGGGAYGAPDLGVEPHLLSDQPGTPFGPWGHRVSNVAVDGTRIGFLDFFDRLGGVDAFGYPKTDARRDDDPAAALRIPGATGGFIRQYFQAAVLEYHPDNPQPVQLLLLGDELRNRLYPDRAYAAFASFNSAEPLVDGQTLVLEAVVPG